MAYLLQQELLVLLFSLLICLLFPLPFFCFFFKFILFLFCNRSLIGRFMLPMLKATAIHSLNSSHRQNPTNRLCTNDDFLTLFHLMFCICSAPTIPPPPSLSLSLCNGNFLLLRYLMQDIDSSKCILLSQR